MNEDYGTIQSSRKNDNCSYRLNKNNRSLNASVINDLDGRVAWAALPCLSSRQYRDAEHGSTSINCTPITDTITSSQTGPCQ